MNGNAYMYFFSMARISTESLTCIFVIIRWSTVKFFTVYCTTGKKLSICSSLTTVLHTQLSTSLGLEQWFLMYFFCLVPFSSTTHLSMDNKKVTFLATSTIRIHSHIVSRGNEIKTSGQAQFNMFLPPFKISIYPTEFIDGSQVRRIDLHRIYAGCSTANVRVSLLAFSSVMRLSPRNHNNLYN